VRLVYPFVKLYENAILQDIELSTVDTQPLESYDLIFVLDFPKSDKKYFKKLIESKFDNLIILIYECEIVMPDNWDKENFKYFKKIFTWHDGKIFKYYFPIKVPKTFNFNLTKKEKLCTLIGSKKFNYHHIELYSERLKAIRWV